MKDLVHKRTAADDSSLSFQERLRRQLGQTGPQHYAPIPRTTCLLLDVSGSMNRPDAGPNLRRIDVLRKVSSKFADVRRFVFSFKCEELGASVSLPADGFGGTAMDEAFLTVRAAGCTHVVVVTDGRPDNAERTLDAARGLKVDCFYVGPDPAPDFLRHLCQQTGGEYGRASLSLTRELEAGVRARLMLEAGKG